MAVKTRMPTSDLAQRRTPSERQPESPMNMRNLPFLLCGIAFVLTLAMFIIGWTDLRDLVVEYVFPAFVIWALLTCRHRGPDDRVSWQLAQDSTSRWMTLILLAVVLLMASGLNILSFGILVAPFGIVLLAVSLFFLLKSRLTKPTSK